ncbi:MAG: hypothetical protein WDM92_05135 [Caulobacteraceae bacterium]
MDRLSESWFAGALSPFEAKGRRIDLRWTAERSGQGPNAFLFGVERQADHEEHRRRRAGRRQPRRLRGLAVHALPRLSTTISVRRDQPSGYDRGDHRPAPPPWPSCSADCR